MKFWQVVAKASYEPDTVIHTFTDETAALACAAEVRSAKAVYDKSYRAWADEYTDNGVTAEEKRLSDACDGIARRFGFRFGTSHYFNDVVVQEIETRDEWIPETWE